MDDDQITRAFLHASVADFEQTTSAVRDQPLDAEDAAQSFAAFTTETLAAFRLAFNQSEGSLAPLAVLRTATAQRMFKPHAAETNLEFFQRLRREAAQCEARWFFVALQATGAVYDKPPDGFPHHINERDSKAILDALRDGHLNQVVCWFSAAREDVYGPIKEVSGIMPLDDDGLAEEPICGGPGGASFLFRGVLDGSVDL